MLVSAITASRSSSARAHIVVAGGGFAAIETLLALRALAADRVRLTVVSPDPAFVYRPSATTEAFDGVRSETYDVAAIADDLGATYHRVRVDAVASQRNWVRLSSGTRVRYDALVLAIGARAMASIAGALTFRGQDDVPQFRRLLDELDAGELACVVFAVPAGRTWHLPMYELALLAAARARARRLKTGITIVTPEPRPLAGFRAAGSRLVAALLDEHGVRFVGKSTSKSVSRDGALVLRSGAPIEADRVVAAPRLRGQRISGVLAGTSGFVPTDIRGRVQGLEDVYAAGDMTAFPIKQGGLAAQQADRIAQTIAASLGLPVRAAPDRFVLRARLLGGPEPVFLRSELDALGRPTIATLERTHGAVLGSHTKVFARYLTPYLERRRLRLRGTVAAA